MGHSRLFESAALELKRRAREVLAGEHGSAALAAALRTAQEGKKKLDAKGAELVDALGLVSQEDLERVSRKIGRLRKRLQTLLDELEK